MRTKVVVIQYFGREKNVLNTCFNSTSNSSQILSPSILTLA
jgi:hypothetical protein